MSDQPPANQTSDQPAAPAIDIELLAAKVERLMRADLRLEQARGVARSKRPEGGQRAS